jgi:hypothetical protein
MSVEHEKAADAAASVNSPADSRPGRTALLASVAVLVGVGAFAGYWTLRQGDFVSHSPAPTTSQAPAAVAPSDLTKESAAGLLNDALARRPVVARLALGDVVTVDKSGQALPLYPRLAQAQIVRLRFCRFPGEAAGANQICLADLTDKATQYVSSAENPFKALPTGTEQPAAKNRSFAQLMLAIPRVGQIAQVTDLRRGEKQIAYTATFEMTPLAATFGLSADALPSSISGTAYARVSGSGWSLESDGLQQTQAKAN